MSIPTTEMTLHKRERMPCLWQLTTLGNCAIEILPFFFQFSLHYWSDTPTLCGHVSHAQIECVLVFFFQFWGKHSSYTLEHTRDMLEHPPDILWTLAGHIKGVKWNSRLWLKKAWRILNILSDKRCWIGNIDPCEWSNTFCWKTSCVWLNDMRQWIEGIYVILSELEPCFGILQ